MNDYLEDEHSNTVAIIGMSGVFPGARDIHEYWQNLLSGVDSITHLQDDEISPWVSADLKQNPQYVKARGIVDDADKFDPAFFGFNALEAEIMDPQQRIFLETAWHAFEDAGYVPSANNELVGVYAGMGNNTYFANNVSHHQDKLQALGPFQAMLLNEKDYLATRVSYALDLKGPSVSVCTACSTSLVAVCQACESLISYQCDVALAGGVGIVTPQHAGYLHEEGMISSSDGVCRPFDSQANGTVFSNGAGAVVLKRYQEAIDGNDRIYALVRGTAVNNDGANKMSFSAPSVSGQIDVIRTAQANADVTADSIGYIETHGSATQLGDAIELEALKQTFSSQADKNYCGIGSVKGNIGHLDAAAGVAGLIKAALALHHKKIPPSIHFHSPNQKIDFANSPFFVVDKIRDWEDQSNYRRAAVSSFGIGGTNAHLILEEAQPSEPKSDSRSRHLVVVSAKSNRALDRATDNICQYLEQYPEQQLADTAYTLQAGRDAFTFRRMVVGNDVDDILRKLKARDPNQCKSGQVQSSKSAVVFMFPGQGAHYINMGRSLYNREPVFRKAVDRCATLLQPHLDQDLRKILCPEQPSSDEARQLLKQTQYNQPAIFTVEWALASLWKQWGVTPAAMIGHSIGEYAAACVAGVFTLEDALRLVSTRGKLMQQMPKGAMLSIHAPVDDIKQGLPDGLSIAAINAPALCVVSGNVEQIDNYATTLQQENIGNRKLETSHAFHSRMMDPILASFQSHVENVRLNEPKIPFVSSSTGIWILGAQATDPAYWTRHLRETVQFSKGIETILEIPNCTLLEVGPRNTCTILANQHERNAQQQAAIPSLNSTFEDDAEFDGVLNAVGQLWLTGVSIDWTAFYANEKRDTVSLPLYPFERQRCWLPASESTPAADTVKKSVQAKPEECHYGIEKAFNDEMPFSGIEQILAEIWQRVLPTAKVQSIHDDFFALGGHSLISVQLLSEVNRRTGVQLPLSTLIDAPTIKQMAAIIDRFDTHKLNTLRTQYNIRNTANRNTKRESSYSTPKRKVDPPWPHLVALQKGGNRIPFFCVHGIGGNILNYNQFIKYMDADQPLYGLQAKGIDGISEPFESIEQMAAAYIEEIRQVQAVGPYFLGGGSMGGLIAFEMAQQLRRQGQEIAVLIMFDTFGPNSSYMQEVCEAGISRIRSICDKFIEQPLRRLPEKIFRSLLSRGKAQFRMARCKLQRKIGIPLGYNIRFWYLEREHIDIINKYRPKVYDRKIILFRACPQCPAEDFDPTNGWFGISKSGIEIVQIAGEHYSFVEEPEVGKKFANYLTNLQVAATQ